MSVYGYALGDEAVQAFTSLRPRQRIKLRRVFDSLARDPNQVGDYREAGASGRNYEVKLFDDLLLGASQFLAQETCITRRLRACLATWRDQRATYTARIRKLSKNWDEPLAAYLVGGSFRNGMIASSE